MKSLTMRCNFLVYINIEPELVFTGVDSLKKNFFLNFHKMLTDKKKKTMNLPWIRFYFPEISKFGSNSTNSLSNERLNVPEGM